MAEYFEDENHQFGDIKTLESMSESELSSFSSRLDKVESAIAKLAGTEDTISQISLELQDVNEQIKFLKDSLRATAGYNIRRTFECSACQTKGVVAIKAVCTKCGEEILWGWWPGRKETL